LTERECDEALRACQRGDDAALARLIAHLQTPLFRLAWRMTGDASLAEDAVAEAFVKLWNKSRQWRGESPAGAWIYQLAVRTTLDVQRSRRRWRLRWNSGSVDDVAAIAPSAGEVLEAAETNEERSARLDAAIQQLSPEDRALVHLYYYENRGLTELGTILGAREDAVKMRLSRARGRLKRALEAGGYGIDDEG
jgi:RNA polymerase sigma-70 factor (ECF subfamily)